MRIESLFPPVRDRLPKRKAKLMEIPGAIDVSAITQCGVYALVLDGRIMFVGWSQRMLTLVSGHETLSHRAPKVWDPIPGVTFDQILVIPCGPDRAKAIAADLIAEHKPKHNFPTRSVVPIRKLA